jgi:hypothetical protein
VFEVRVRRGIFGFNRRKATEGWKNLQKMEPHNLCSSITIRVKRKGDVFPLHAMKAYRGSISPRILNFGIRLSAVLNIRHRPL